MLTFQNLYERAMDMTGVQTSDSVDIPIFKQDVNQGLRLFKNAARRYWTRLEKSTDVVANQQYYQLPPDCVRVTAVRVLSSGLNYPVQQIDSEELWNAYNIIPATTINLPQFYFIRGNNEIGLYPIPSTSYTNGLNVSYEPRIADMQYNDVTNVTSGATATIANGTTTVTFSGNIVTPNMVGRWVQFTDGSDGGWYKITVYNSTSSFEINNNYAGVSGAAKTFTIGECPDIPEDYQLGLAYYAAYNFYLKRKDSATATLYKGLFEDLLQQYKDNYAAKTTGQVQKAMPDGPISLFWFPPTGLTG